MVSRKIIAAIVVLLLCGISVSQAEFFHFQQGTEDPCHPGSGIYDGGHDLTIGNPSVFGAVQWVDDNPDRLRMRYKSGKEEFNTLIRFDNLNETLEGQIIADAYVTLYFNWDKLEYSSATIDVYPLMKPWNDPNCDWNYADIDPPTVYWDVPGAQHDPNDRGDLILEPVFMGPRYGNPIWQQYPENHPFDFTLSTDLVHRWVYEPATNYGIIMVMNPGAASDVLFYSNEESDTNYHPKLTIITASCGGLYEADLNDDCYVNLLDYAILANQWLDDLRADIAPGVGDNIVDIPDLQVMANQWLLEATSGETLTADLDGDGKVNLFDYAILADQWLTQKALTADIAPLGGDKKIDLYDLQFLLNQWLKCSNLSDNNCEWTP